MSQYIDLGISYEQDGYECTLCVLPHKNRQSLKFECTDLYAARPDTTPGRHLYWPLKHKDVLSKLSFKNIAELFKSLKQLEDKFNEVLL